MSKYWFKPKKYGYGTYPITWQGWLATLGLCILIIVSCYVNIPAIETLKGWLRFILDVIILAILFLILFKEKTDGEIRWRWGKE